MDNPLAPPGSPAPGDRDIPFTRLARAVEGRVRLLVDHLAGRFESAGLGCDVRQRQTPRGPSTFVALVGPRGLLCIVDMTVIEGTTRAGEPGARLDIRLLDACGDPVANCSTRSADCHSAADDILAPAQLGPRATAIHLVVMGVFGLPARAPRGGEPAVP